MRNRETSDVAAVTAGYFEIRFAQPNMPTKFVYSPLAFSAYPDLSLGNQRDLIFC
ncbi:MAG: hypothetical protein QW364_02780 [Thermoplasmatales archaeon]